MSTVIRVEHVTKSYRLGAIGGATLKEDFARWWARKRGRPDPLALVDGEAHARQIGDQFWALDDVSFDVAEGQVLGIIGRNGAGKSTMLKILSQVTAPTSGQIRLKGRIASLLEVGTGFHPELTGRENTFLNGAILGMSTAETRRKLDEIIAFSGVEQFIDTPVKRYSSGMYVRLAFAVAAHLEPEILIVDEVLAVGDAEFQAKCLGKMGEVAKGGRTILFVSHNLSAIRSLCDRVVWLDAGRVRMEGTPSDVIEAYLRPANSETERGIIDERTERSGTGEARFKSVTTSTASGEASDQFYYGQTPIIVRGVLDVAEALPATVLELSLCTTDGLQVTFASTLDVADCAVRLAPGRHYVQAEIDATLVPGRYWVLLGLHRHPNGRTVDFVPRALDFEVLSSAQGSAPDFPYAPRGFVRPIVRWQLEQVPEHPNEICAQP